MRLPVGGRKISAHKVALVSHSPYLHGLLTSGLAESKQGGDTLKIGDDSTDGRAVEAIVDCFYSGELSLSRGSVGSVIRTANLFGVDAVEKVACDFFIESLELSTACEALAFAAEHVACGEHARVLHERCAGYMVEHFAECCVEPSFLDLSSEAVAEVIGSDDLPVEEAVVVTVVRAWFDHDASGRAESLAVLINGTNMDDVMTMSVIDASAFFEGLELSGHEAMIAKEILKEVRQRLKFRCLEP